MKRPIVVAIGNTGEKVIVPATVTAYVGIERNRPGYCAQIGDFEVCGHTIEEACDNLAEVLGS
jgi:hypothetical protein